MCKLFLAIVIFIFSLSIRECVDKRLFKTCSQSPHCKRFSKFVSIHEGLSTEAFHRFVVVKDTIETPDLNKNTNLARFQLKNTLDDSILIMSLRIIDYGIIRITIDESFPTPLRQRYQVPRDDVLQDTKLEVLSQKTKLKVRQHSNVLHIETETNNRNFTVIVEFEPFVLKVYNEKQLIQSLNSKELLNFERYRKQTTNKAQGQSANEEEPSASEEVHEELNEEKFFEPKKDKPPVDAVEIDDTDSWSSIWAGESDILPFGPSAVGVDVSFWGANHIFGLSLHTNPLSLPEYSEPYRSWNSDVFEYELNSPMALYGTIPFVLALHSGVQQQNLFSGFVWINPSDTWITVKKNVEELDGGTRSTFLSETGIMDMLFLLGPTPQAVMLQYYEATGYPAAAPLFSLGKHQSRWNYDNESDVRQISNNFAKYNIPLDAIWLDIEHTHGKRYFTWDPVKFPNPKKLIEEIANNGQKTIAIVDPHIKDDKNFLVYDILSKEDGFIKDKDDKNTLFFGRCWAGNSAYPDFLSPKVRNIFKTFYLPMFWNGTDDHNVFLWNDMNEPSVFDKPEVTVSRGAWHLDNREHREVHNLYGMLYHRTTHEALLKRNGNIRPFILSRSFYIGSHKYGAVWTGDNDARWDHLRMSVPMLLSLALNGFSFVGADIPGFFHNPSSELMSRWMQAGAWYPFFRSHACDTTARREPWLFEKSVQNTIRNTVQTRYSLMPTWYTAFMEYALRGYPIIKPIWWNSAMTSKNSLIFDFQDKGFMVGDLILVYAVSQPMDELENLNHHTLDQFFDIEPTKMMKVYLPQNNDESVVYTWYDFHSGQPIVSKDTVLEWPITFDRIPIFVKAGTILFIKEAVRRSTASQQHDPLTLVIFMRNPLKSNPTNYSATLAAGRIFIDDGSTFNYLKKQEFAYDEFTLTQTTENQLVLTNKPLSVAVNPSDSKNATFGLKQPLTVNTVVNNLVIRGLSKPPKSVKSYSASSAVTDLTYQVYKHSLIYEVKIKKPKFTVGIQHKVEINF